MQRESSLRLERRARTSMRERERERERKRENEGEDPSYFAPTSKLLRVTEPRDQAAESAASAENLNPSEPRKKKHPSRPLRGAKRIATSR